jgi:D-aminoacyl-tRNA deacylase
VRAVIQRVKKASVTVNKEIIGKINYGFVILLGVAQDDNENDADYLVNRIANLRIFSDDKGKFNLSALQIDADMLIISQFTLMADAQKGRRPSFTSAAPSDKAESLYNYFVKEMKEMQFKTETGIFGAHMLVNIANDGPVTICLDSKEKFP